MDFRDLSHGMAGLAELIASFVIVTGLAQNLFHGWQLILAARALRRSRGLAETAQVWRRYAESAPPISLLVPAYNEELTIVESLRSLLGLQYPTFEVVVVNDGSRDGTLKALIDYFDLKPVERSYERVAPHAEIRGLYGTRAQPRLTVVDKQNGGKADALNAAINLSRAPILCSMDADSLLEPDALLRAVGPFVEDPVRVVAVGGAIRVINGCQTEFGRVTRVAAPRNFLALLQTMEYLRAFLMARLAWSEMGVLLIISGAFGLFRREAVIAVGGYSLGTVGEDMELVVKLHKHARRTGQPHRVVFRAEPVCWTEAPETLGVLGRQRARWHRGALETFVRHRDMLFNPLYGRIGWLGFGYILIVDVLGPFIDLFGYLLIPTFWALGVLNADYLYAFLAVGFGYGVVISLGALALEEIELRRFPNVHDLTQLMLIGVVENFGYRQLNTFWRLRGAWQFFTKQHAWGAMTRRGFTRS